MSRKYTISRTIKTPYGDETFTAVEFESFDEARVALEKGVYDRKLQLDQESKKVITKEKSEELATPDEKLIPEDEITDEIISTGEVTPTS